MKYFELKTGFYNRFWRAGYFLSVSGKRYKYVYKFIKTSS